MAQKNNHYAYLIPAAFAKGGKERTGVTDSWKACEAIVSGVAGARYRGFPTRREAEAWLAAGARYESRPAKESRRHLLEPGIYFDAGTGRGDGVEINVTDEKGKSLLHKAAASARPAISKFGTHRVENDEATNNYGELLALKYALEIAARESAKKIFGDSKLVIEYWSRWKIKRKEVAPETARLADEVSALRERFESQGGAVARISGDDNPADLGFHR